MLKKLIGISLVALITSGCATTHPGKLGHTVDGPEVLPLKISARPLENAYKDPFEAIEITIENMGTEWLRIHEGQIVISDPATSKLSIVVGHDLNDWVEATRLKTQKDDYNSSLAQGVLALAGSAVMVAGGASGNSNLAAAGAVGALSGVGWGALSTIRKEKNKAEGAVQVPENYISAPCNIPGHLFSRRWVLLNKPVNSKIDSLIVELETIEGHKEKYEIPLL